jgi:hypothetical protein
MRRICIVTSIAAALLVPSAAGAAGAKWMPPLSQTADSAEKLSGELAVFARARASVKTPELPRTGPDPGLIALCGLGIGLTGAGMRRLLAPR